MPMIISQCDSSNNVKLATKIFDEYGNFIRTVVNCRLRDEHLRNDIYQDFFLSLVRRPIPEEVTNMKSYLYRAICNDIYDAKRRLNRYEQHLQKHRQLAATVGLAFAPDKSLVDAEEVCKLFDIIETQLSSSEAKALKLRYQSELNNPEIAERLNVGHATVSTYMSTGLKRLREMITKGQEREQND